ncbi:MAG: ABC transporter substrate-binding protein [Comamonas sp.]|jgi:iron complex transport system substrate-binding protein|uniref:ABC transporter substrate-binding protein n=1 Tax=Comamonas sp. TaxID=34028 RepID=UPI00281D93BB|nr:ABC transporter substrate-binding protein [Comamonas sp.]MDR0215356.1 ABC transporter substrate-binding protein [Comamonas sp.]
MRRPLFTAWVLPLALLAAGCSDRNAAQTAAARAPQGAAMLSLDVCGQPVHYDRIAQQAVTSDVNITEMFLYLGLGSRLVAYSGIPSIAEISPQLRPVLQRLPNLSSQEMNMETLLGTGADFVFAGWGYGFRPGGITPQRLSSHGIASYVLSESCIHVQKRERIALDDALLDMENISRIFGVAQQTRPRIEKLRTSLALLRQQMQGNPTTRPRVFVYDSGQETPTTAGHFGMPQAMLDEAGATNIFADLPNNWPQGNWEDVIERDPEWIVIIDYGRPSAQGKIDFLLQKKELEAVSAIRNRRFFVMSYAEATPGPRNIEATQRLAATLHPEHRISIQPVAFSAGDLP